MDRNNVRTEDVVREKAPEGAVVVFLERNAREAAWLECVRQAREDAMQEG